MGAAALTVALAACGSPDSGVSRDAPSSPPSRVVATAPAIVETLYALGLGDRVVGVGDFATWPPEVEEKPRIGGLFDPQLETIADLEPDLAILLVSEKGLEEPLRRLGVEVMLLEVESVEDAEQAIEAIARRMGVEARANEMLAGWRADLAPDSPTDAAGSVRTEPPRVLLSIVRDGGRLSGILTAGRQTFYQELLERLGAENVFAEAPVRYPQVSAEEIVARRPTVLIELQPRPLEPASADALLGDWDAVPFAEPPCRRVVAGAYALLPGPRLPRLYQELREAIVSCTAPSVESPAP